MGFPMKLRALVVRITLTLAASLISLALVTAAISPDVAMGASIREGDVAPLFIGVDLQGVSHNLQDHIGKDVIMLDFWSIYCVSCVQEMPKLVALHKKYKDQGFVAFGIDLDSFSVRRVKRFVNGLNYDVSYPIIVDRKREIAGAYKVSMLPTTIFIGKDGKVKLFHIGYKPGNEDEFDDLIEKLIK
ncbi:MAG TPA: redoxin domain-containing protein [Proteobacteria bacterium]|nr:thiol-disulfide oxidoreductase ResA [bacterium BMS3Abin14]HDL52951.1 redoxin domain-containing protein [Pseudomonadota bacterium]